LNKLINYKVLSKLLTFNNLSGVFVLAGHTKKALLYLITTISAIRRVISISYSGTALVFILLIKNVEHASVVIDLGSASDPIVIEVAHEWLFLTVMTAASEVFIFL
jgi:hypothetical protein